MDPHAHENPTIIAASETIAVAPSVPAAGAVDLLAAPSVATSTTFLKRISWGAVFAGAAVASVLSIWFNLLGLAIGLAVFEPLAQQAAGFGIGTVIWVLATAIICLFAGGWVAGRLSGTPVKLDRALHGVVAWSVAALFGLYVVTAGATRVAAGTASMLGDVAGGAARAGLAAGTDVAQQVDLPPEIQQDLEGLVREAKQDPQLRDSVKSVLTGEASAQDRARLAQELAERGDMSQAEAEQKLVQWEQRAQELKYTVASTAEQAADTLSAVAFLGVLSMLFGLGSSALGAVSAYPDRKRRNAVLTPKS